MLSTQTNQFWAPSKCRGNSTGNNGEGKDVRVSQRTETDNKLHKQHRLQCPGGGFVNVFQARCKKRKEKKKAQYCTAEQQSEYTQGQGTILPWAEQ